MLTSDGSTIAAGTFIADVLLALQGSEAQARIAVFAGFPGAYGVRCFARNGIFPGCCFCRTEDWTWVIIDGVRVNAQVVSTISGYTFGQKQYGQLILNGFADQLATMLMSELPNGGRGINIVFGGYSLGGLTAMTMALQRIYHGGVPLSSMRVVTIGSPRQANPIGRAYAQGMGGQAFMQDADFIGVVPPHLSEAPLFYAPLAITGGTAIGTNSFQQVFPLTILYADGTVGPADNPPNIAQPFAANLVQQVFAESQSSKEHSLKVYRQLINQYDIKTGGQPIGPTAVSGFSAVPSTSESIFAQTLKNSSIGLLDVSLPVSSVETVINQTIALYNGRLHNRGDLVAIPRSLRASPYRGASDTDWRVRWINNDIAVNCSRARAHGISRTVNKMARELLGPAAIDGGQFADSLANFVTIAANPLSGVSPALISA